MNELRYGLAGEIAQFRRSIEESRVMDKEPRSGWRKIVHEIGSFVGGESQESIAKRQYGPQIAKRLKVMDGINNGDENVAKEYLVDEIEEAIAMARRGLLITGDRSSGHVWIVGAQRDIDLLGKYRSRASKKITEKIRWKNRKPPS